MDILSNMSWILNNTFYLLETIGICSFALSGIVMAKRKDFDPVGLFIIASATAFGGGTIRDLILDNHPVYWIRHWEYPVMILIFTIILFNVKKFELQEKWLIVPDAMGLALFTISSTQTGHAAGYPFIIVAILATMSGTFGGLIRDILCNEAPIILRKENFYASIAFFGSTLFLILSYIGQPKFIASLIATLFIFIFRLLAYRFNWRFK